MSATYSLTTDQGAALLWLQKAGGRAGCSRDGTVFFGRDICPLVFANFDALERAGLVEMRLHRGGSGCRLHVLLTGAGADQAVDPAAERRLDQLMRRFDD